MESSDPRLQRCRQAHHPIIERFEEKRKSTKNIPMKVDELFGTIKNTSKQYQQELEEKRKQLEKIVEENFPGKYFPLEVALSVKAQEKIECITQPFALILMGQPSSYKTTILDIVKELPNCYYTDKFTARSFVSHAAGVPREKLEQIDLLPRIKGKTLVTPELSTIFTQNPDEQHEVFGILTKILDGKGYKCESGVYGQRGYEGNYFFTWLGAVVDIPHPVWKLLGNLGFKISFLRLDSEQETLEEKTNRIIQSIRGKPYSQKLDEAKVSVKEYWSGLESFFDNSKIKCDDSKDDSNSLERIVTLADILSHLRATVPTWHKQSQDEFSYIFERPTIEEPSRATNALYNLARGHAVLYGRNYITKDDLKPVVAVALSSASIERVELFKLLILNDGKLDTNQFMDKVGVSRDTALKNMEQLKLLGLVDMEDEPASTKPIKVVRLKQSYKWCLSEEFKSLLTHP